MDENEVTVGLEDGQVHDETLADHLGSWHHWPAEGTDPNAWPFEHLVRVHGHEHTQGEFDYHSHPVA